MRLAIGQMTATDDLQANLAVGDALAAQAGERGARLLVLPENFAFFGRGDGDVAAVAEPLDGPLFGRWREIAQRRGIWLACGGFAERGADGKVYNAHVIVDDGGAVRAAYRKIHLFDVELGGGRVYRESATIAPGDAIVVAESPVGSLGLSVCYDLRFGELYAALVSRGAQVLLVPAAFTLTTGKEHWEPLLRARAIETQCYVAAAAQTGRHNDRRETYGHALIVDPWGTVVAQCRDGTGLAVADIDRAWLEAVRARIPVARHRRPDLFRS